jgi:hypothetical protein
MTILTRENQKILNDLVKLAHDRPELVKQALVKLSPSEPNLSQVVDYILEHRGEGHEPDPEPVP